MHLIGVNKSESKCKVQCIIKIMVSYGHSCMELFLPFPGNCPRLLPLLPMASWKVRAFSLCMVFTSSRLSRAVPHGTKGTSPEFVTRPVYSRSQLQEQHEHYCCSSSTDAFISYSIYTVCRYRTSPGAPDLRARLG